jgi:hypothetical protein
MVLDPISALSVAAAAVQFVQFSSQLVSKGRHIYHSSHGAAEENEIAETVTLRLQELTQRLAKASIEAKASNQTVASDNAHLRLNDQGSSEMQEHHERVHSICKECETLSNTLLDRLHKLKIPTGSEHRRWKSFRHALKDVWSKADLDRMSERLRLLREELDSHMLFILRYVQPLSTARSIPIVVKPINNRVRATMNHMSEDMCKVLQSLDENTRRIISSLDKAQTTQKRTLQGHFDQLTSYQRQHYERSRSAFVQDDAENRKTSVQFHILQSLRFAEMSHRADALTPAHAQTFRWLFQDLQTMEQQRASFQTWLSDCSGLYWVNGKAGSGKSTLLRFIWEQRKTWECLDNWAEGSEIIAGAFYFWNSGVAEQRSHSGFLRSLLYEVLKKRGDLIATVFPDEWEQTCALSSQDRKLASIDWTLSRLQTAFQRLVGLATKDLRFCFFIDGLDEYDGCAGDIAEYIVSLSSDSPYAKFCVSSRPWPVFENVFQDSPGLRLQDLTKEDIRAYVNDKLGKNKHIQELWVCEPENTTELIEEVVDKAAGVFLWVQLVIRSLIGGLRDGDEISHLRSRLASLPPDLETLYEHMLDRIEPEYRLESAKIFQIFRANKYGLGIQTLYRALSYSNHRQVVDMACSNNLPLSGVHPTDTRLEPRMTRMMSRLNSRTKGLLETHDTRQLDDGDEPFHYQSTATCVVHKRGQTGHASSSRSNESNYHDVFEARHKIRIPSLITPTSESRKLGRNRYDYRQIPALNVSEPGRLASVASNGKPLNAATDHEKLRETSWPQQSPYITFIHRTARDYMEKNQVWKRIADETSKTDFNPHIALLAAYVLEVKTTPFTLELLQNSEISRHQVASKMFRWLGGLQVPVGSSIGDALIEELDKVLTYGGIPSAARGSTPEMHWSVENATPANRLIFGGQQWKTDILSMAVSCRVDWYFLPKLQDVACPLLLAKRQNRLLPYQHTRQERDLPLLAFALGFHGWSGQGLAQKPDTDAVGILLEHCQNPNSIFGDFSLWEYVIHYVHIIHVMEKKNPDLVAWLRVFELLLQYGADPYACCIENSKAFADSVGLVENGDMGYNEAVVAKHCLRNVAAHPLESVSAFRKSADITSDAHARHHSVTAVVYDAFAAHATPGWERLVALLNEKKRLASQGRKQKRKKGHLNNNFAETPRWVS